jgi:catechol 2,3-dioxygenase-like lactoylglutathione lyase family enzyme
MKRFHIALAVSDLNASIDDYSARLGQPPQAVVTGTYAMWRTDQLNFSIRQQPDRRGQLCNFGFEDDDATGFTSEVDANGIPWERFSTVEQDLQVILAYGVPIHPVPTEDDLIRN